MPNISGKDLVLIIQAVDFKIDDLERSIDASPDSDESADFEEILVSYTNTAEVLKRAYKEAQGQLANLPPYEALVRSE